MIAIERLEELISQFGRLTIGLVGDLFLDRYLEIDASLHELSLETGLEAYQVVAVRNAAGALGTVMNNLASLGVGRLVPVTVIGDDGHGYDLQRELRQLPIDATHIYVAPHRLTPTYTKPVKRERGDWRELNRLDVRTRSPLDDETALAVCRSLDELFDRVDGWIVLDQIPEPDCGVVCDRVRRRLKELSERHPRQLVVIDSRCHLSQFSFGVLKGNEREMTAAVADELPGASAEEAAERLARRTGRTAFCTLGERGMLVARPDGPPQWVAGFPVSGPIDIVGAGDSATSGIVAGLLAGATEWEAAELGNLVASITVQQLGTTGRATPDQLRARWHEVAAGR